MINNLLIMPDDSLEARQKKELKALEAEKRAALKRIKGTAGKSKTAKELLAACEAEFDEKLKILGEKHQAELVPQTTSGTPCKIDVEEENQAEPPQSANTVDPPPEDLQNQQFKKQEKSRRRREKARDKERERESRIAEENANAGPSARQVEMDTILKVLPSDLRIVEVPADGNCLYRAVGAQCGKDYQQIRALCAESLLQHSNEFEPFCEFSESIPDFKTYVERVRSTSDWGGHLELRALSVALQRPVWIFSTDANPLVVDSEQNDAEPILISYHRRYYALGEHYNQVVRMNE